MHGRRLVLSLLLCACAPEISGRVLGDASVGRDLSRVPADLLSPTLPPAGDGSIDPGGGDPSDGCPEEAKLVYVVDANNQFSSFDPPTLAFRDLGVLRCPAQAGATPFSMSVDRSAAAWVLYSSGELFKVDTTGLGCTATGFQPNQQGLLVFGMGFVADAPGQSTDTLFVAGGSQADIGQGVSSLATIDASSLKVTRLVGMQGSPELTGTGDAALWGFFPDQRLPKVAQIDKKTGALSSISLLAKIAGEPRAWAFAHWGGDFWIFLQRPADPSTQVHRLRKATGALDTVIPNTGRRIVGAGVSTCAPITIG